ncbi:HD domain-containing protein [Streptomyces longispororuber]|uniref:HD domain-containing protein n=1 Tax=Streptomyces longispororuber TaxID=68230 RepID=UPI0033D0CB5A
MTRDGTHPQTAPDVPASTDTDASTDTAWGALRELGFPESALALEAVQYVRTLEAPALFHHSMRTYLYGRRIGERQGLVPGRDYDDELFFLGSVLHDLGLTEEGDRDQRFDVDGADVAAEFLTRHGVAADRVEVVWDAIALHTSEGIASRKRPEIALVSAGTRLDIAGDAGQLPPGYADRVHAVLPRLHAAPVLRAAIVSQALAKPGKAPLYSLPGELTRQWTGAPAPTWEEVTQAPGWNDYEGYTG